VKRLVDAIGSASGFTYQIWGAGMDHKRSTLATGNVDPFGSPEWIPRQCWGRRGDCGV